MSDYEYEYLEEREQRPARQRRRSRYERPRSYISWTVIILGVILGILAGVNFAWNIQPIEEVDTSPRQLRDDAKTQYAVAILLDYGYNNNLGETVQRLSDLNLAGNDPIQAVADVACQLASTGYVNSSSGIRAVQIMMQFYQGQGRAGCADELIPLNILEGSSVVQITVPTATPQLISTKTPTPIGTPVSVASATPQASTLVPNINTANFEVIDVRTFCDSELSGIIEARVWEGNNDPYPGQAVRVRWNGGESIFFTGLKSERGLDFADFQMEAGVEYTIDMPGLSDPYPTPLSAGNCDLGNGNSAITSYRVWFREQ